MHILPNETFSFDFFDIEKIENSKLDFLQLLILRELIKTAPLSEFIQTIDGKNYFWQNLGVLVTKFAFFGVNYQKICRRLNDLEKKGYLEILKYKSYEYQNRKYTQRNFYHITEKIEDILKNEDITIDEEFVLSQVHLLEREERFANHTIHNATHKEETPNGTENINYFTDSMKLKDFVFWIENYTCNIRIMLSDGSIENYFNRRIEPENMIFYKEK